MVISCRAVNTLNTTAILIRAKTRSIEIPGMPESSVTSLTGMAWTADLVLVSIGNLPNNQVAINVDIITNNSICGDQYRRSSVTKYMG